MSRRSRRTRLANTARAAGLLLAAGALAIVGLAFIGWPARVDPGRRDRSGQWIGVCRSSAALDTQLAAVRRRRFGGSTAGVSSAAARGRTATLTRTRGARSDQTPRRRPLLALVRSHRRLLRDVRWQRSTEQGRRYTVSTLIKAPRLAGWLAAAELVALGLTQRRYLASAAYSAAKALR